MLRRRMRRVPETFGRKIFDFGIVTILTLILFTLSRKDWTQYRIGYINISFEILLEKIHLNHVIVNW